MPNRDDQTIRRALRILESRLQKTEGFIRDPADAERYAMLRIADRPAEVFGVFFLNTQGALIEFREMFQGTIDAASVFPREVVRAVIETNAAAVVFCHNHPSAAFAASDADRNITRRLQMALALIDVRVLDHIIVAGSRTLSFTKMGYL